MRPLLPAGLLALLGLALLPASSARAHAEPDTVSPGAGAVLVQPPAEVVIEFSQEVVRGDESGIDVVDEAGEEVTVVDAVVDNGNRRRMSVLLPATLQPGVYTVRWRTLSAEDGDTASGEFQFTYDPAGTPDPGQTKLREDVLAPGGGATPAPVSPLVVGDGGGGTSWILVAAVAVGMFTLGSGITYLLVQKRG
jgi:methionine-rich copper-binding protein CopC